VFRNYLTVALRNLLRHKTYSIINIAGLAIGMACCIVISMQLVFELSYDRFHEKSERIYRMTTAIEFKAEGPTKLSWGAYTIGAVGPVIKKDYPEVIENARIQGSSAIPLQYAGRNQMLRPISTETPFFNIFSFEFEAGDPETALADPNNVVLTKDAARRLFGDEDPMGKVVRYEEGQTDYKVTGVLRDIPKNSHLQFDMLLPLDQNHPQLNVFQGSHNYINYLLLKEGAKVESLRRKMPEFLKTYMPNMVDPEGYFAGYEFIFQPLRDIHLHSTGLTFDDNDRKGDMAIIYFYIGIALILLLIAVVNFINLTTARSAGRAREVGVRKVAGASRGQLVGQFLGESIVISIVALFLAISLIEISRPALTGIINNLDINSYFGSWVFVAIALSVTIAVGILAGAYPAFFVSAFKPIAIIRGISSSGTPKGLLLRRSLVVAQFSASIILVVCTLFISRQLNYLHSRKMGFDKDLVVVVDLTLNMRKKFETIRQELLQHPDITVVATSCSIFGGFISKTGFTYEGDISEKGWNVPYMRVDYDFLSLYGLELAQGRDFSPQHATDLNQACIINETLARQIGWESPLGKMVRPYKGEGTVIGVVKDFNFASLHDEIQPLVLFMEYSDYLKNYSLGAMSVKIKPDNVAATLAFMEKVWTSHEPGYPFDYMFLDQHLQALYDSEQRVARIIGVFSLLAVFISCLGLLGLISFSAQQRTKEIGVRRVLGASVGQMVLLLCRESIVLVGISIALALPAAWYLMDRWLQNFAYRIELGPETFILGGVIALVIALLTVSFQAVKAATANPVDALRYE
jgi:putative ABC transport system permease protein